jgi:hypothetical protein
MTPQEETEVALNQPHLSYHRYNIKFFVGFLNTSIKYHHFILLVLLSLLPLAATKEPVDSQGYDLFRADPNIFSATYYSE